MSLCQHSVSIGLEIEIWHKGRGFVRRGFAAGGLLWGFCRKVVCTPGRTDSNDLDDNDYDYDDDERIMKSASRFFFHKTVTFGDFFLLSARCTTFLRSFPPCLQTQPAVNLIGLVAHFVPDDMAILTFVI